MTKRHTGIEKKFPSYFASFKLPAEAVEDSLVVYRACVTNKVDRESFLPSCEENNFAQPKDPTEPGSYSLSVYENPKDLKRFAGLTSSLRPPLQIAKGTTEPCCGVIQRTRERTKEKTSHVDWWLYENAVPHEHFWLVDDFATELKNFKPKG